MLHGGAHASSAAVDHFSSSISAIVTADYRLDGREEVIVCSSDGEGVVAVAAEDKCCKQNDSQGGLHRFGRSLYPIL